MSAPVALAAAWLLVCAITAVGFCKLTRLGPRPDHPSYRQPDRLGRLAKISPFHGDRYDR